MSTFKEAVLGIKPLFKDLELVEKRSSLIVVEWNTKKYGISLKRIEKSSCSDDTELYISEDGKWLIPSDTTTTGGVADW